MHKTAADDVVSGAEQAQEEREPEEEYVHVEAEEAVGALDLAQDPSAVDPAELICADGKG